MLCLVGCDCGCKAVFFMAAGDCLSLNVSRTELFKTLLGRSGDIGREEEWGSLGGTIKKQRKANTKIGGGENLVDKSCSVSVSCLTRRACVKLWARDSPPVYWHAFLSVLPALLLVQTS